MAAAAWGSRALPILGLLLELDLLFFGFHLGTTRGGFGVSSGSVQLKVTPYCRKLTFLFLTSIIAPPSINVGIPRIASYPANPAIWAIVLFVQVPNLTVNF